MVGRRSLHSLLAAAVLVGACVGGCVATAPGSAVVPEQQEGLGTDGLTVGESAATHLGGRAVHGTQREATSPRRDVPGRIRAERIETTPPPRDSTTIRIRVDPNGSATWTVEVRTEITNETDHRDYRRFQAQFRNDTERYLGPFREDMIDTVAAAENLTGRSMSARNFSARTRIQTTPREWGIVEYRFRWDGFGVTGDDAIRLGDVFERGYYLTGGDTMVIEAPPEYRISDARPTPKAVDERVVRWVGPIDFADERPSVRMVPDAGPTTGSGDTAGSDTQSGAVSGTDSRESGSPSSDTPRSTEERSGTGGGSLFVYLGGAALLVVAGGAYVVIARGREESPVESDDGPPESTEQPADELVTDEERVIALLDSEGGRMRQSDIAEELGWSAPKTSRVLSKADEEGRIEKLRLGNENVIDLVDDGE